MKLIRHKLRAKLNPKLSPTLRQFPGAEVKEDAKVEEEEEEEEEDDSSNSGGLVDLLPVLNDVLHLNLADTEATRDLDRSQKKPAQIQLLIVLLEMFSVKRDEI